MDVKKPETLLTFRVEEKLIQILTFDAAANGFGLLNSDLFSFQ